MEDKWVEKTSEQSPVTAPMKGPMLQRDSWMMAPPDGGFLPVTSRAELRAQAKQEADEQQKEKNLLDGPGQHSRELNPYWKDGGIGMPEQLAEKKSAAASHVAGDGGIQWLRKAIQRCEEQAAERGVSVEEVAAERHKSFEDLQNRLREAEENAMMAQRNRHRPRSRDRSRASRVNERQTGSDSKSDKKRDSRSDSSSSSGDNDSRRRRRNSKEIGRRDRDRKSSRDRGRNNRDRQRSSEDRDRSRDRDRSSRDRDRSSRDRNRDRRSRDRDRSRERYRTDTNRSRDSYRSSYSDRTDSSRGTSGLKSLRGKFKRPDQNSDSDSERKQTYSRTTKDNSREATSSGWRKKAFMKPDTQSEDSKQSPPKEKISTSQKETVKSVSTTRNNKDKKPQRKPSPESGSSADSSSSSSDSEKEEVVEKNAKHSQPEEEETVILLSEQEMNKLGAKIVRAEIMGDQALADKLKSQLDSARKAKEEAPQMVRQSEKQTQQRSRAPKQDEEVLLTRTDRKGMVRPVVESEDTVSMPTSKKRRKAKKEKTHSGAKGERERYFADDDRYDLKTLVKQEKLGTAETHDEMFMRLAGKQADKATDDWDVDDMFVERAAKQTSDSMKEKRDKIQAIMEHKKVSSALDKCSWCFEKVPKHLIIAIGIKVYLCLPEHRSLTEGHCMIVPMQHVSQGTSVDEDVWDEIQVFRKGLTKMFEAQGEDCVFMEMCKNLQHHPHMFIDCVPIPKETGDMAPLYFRKAILDCDAEWTQNKKVVDLSQKGIRNSVPKGFPYFSVDFGLQGGFAHVIEDEAVFQNYFGREIVGGMIDAGPELWRKPHKEHFEQQRQKVLAFAECWRPYDWTQRLKSKEGSSGSDSD